MLLLSVIFHFVLISLWDGISRKITGSFRILQDPVSSLNWKHLVPWAKQAGEILRCACICSIQGPSQSTCPRRNGVLGRDRHTLTDTGVAQGLENVLSFILCISYFFLSERLQGTVLSKRCSPQWVCSLHCHRALAIAAALCSFSVTTSCTFNEGL